MVAMSFVWQLPPADELMSVDGEKLGQVNARVWGPSVEHEPWWEMRRLPTYDQDHSS
jgi:hypothetical protein